MQEKCSLKSLAALNLPPERFDSEGAQYEGHHAPYESTSCASSTVAESHPGQPRSSAWCDAHLLEREQVLWPERRHTSGVTQPTGSAPVHPLQCLQCTQVSSHSLLSAAVQ